MWKRRETRPGGPRYREVLCGRERPGSPAGGFLATAGQGPGRRALRGRARVTAPHPSGQGAGSLPWAKGMIPDESRDAGNPHVRFDGRGEENSQA